LGKKGYGKELVPTRKGGLGFFWHFFQEGILPRGKEGIGVGIRNLGERKVFPPILTEPFGEEGSPRVKGQLGGWPLIRNWEGFPGRFYKGPNFKEVIIPSLEPWTREEDQG